MTSLGEITAAMGSTTTQASSWLGANWFTAIIIFLVLLALTVVGVFVWLWFDQAKETKIVLFDNKRKVTIIGKQLKAATFQLEKGGETYKSPESPFVYDGGFWGVKPLAFYVRGRPLPLTLDEAALKLGISGESLNKIIDNEQLKILMTPKSSPKDLIMGIALGAAGVFLVLFVCAAFKWVVIGGCPKP